jgi:hypothetical protein
MDAESKAKELWAKEIKRDGAWTRANGFPTEEAAKMFVKWLEDNGYAHQGIHKYKTEAYWKRLREIGRSPFTDSRIYPEEEVWSVDFR